VGIAARCVGRFVGLAAADRIYADVRSGLSRQERGWRFPHAVRACVRIAPAIQTLEPTSTNNVKSDAAAAQVLYLRDAKIQLYFSNMHL